MQFLHTMVRVTDLDASLHFYCDLLGLHETRRYENEKGRFTLVFLCAPKDAESATSEQAPLIELTYNWDQQAEYTTGKAFGHMAFRTDDLYALCDKLQKAGVIINRPPRDGHMAFVKSPDNISIELLQKGENLPKTEPWASMENIGDW